MPALVEVENLAVDFATAHGTVPALKGVSFSLDAGEALGIVGESGSGKTVACRAILRLLATNALVRSGTVRFAGQDVLGMNVETLGRFRGEQAAMIFQNPSTHLDPIMKIGRQVGEAIVKHRGVSWIGAREKAIQLLEAMQIPDARHRIDAYPHELSGGMRQRVMIAAALACEPKLLIADEPTTALDVTVQAQILELLRRIRRERQLSLILVSHDLGVIAEMCDRVVVMKDGDVVETGSVGQILRNPKQEYTRRLIASQPSLMRVERRRSAPSPTAIQPQLEVEGLSVRFAGARGIVDWAMRKPAIAVNAVNGVSFSLERGGAIGIVGESGSGKSTIARALVGLVEPWNGTIRRDGKIVDTARKLKSPQEYRRLQMVFQDPFLSLNPAFTVAQTLIEPLKQHRLCKDDEIPGRVSDLMVKVELPIGLLNRKTTQLSGGQRQRVGIARALALEPEILIADEVTSALDVTIQAQVLGLLSKLRREMGLSLIVISHDLAVVRYLCDRVLVMRRGELVESGPAEEVLDRPRHDYTRALLAAIPRLSLE